MRIALSVLFVLSVVFLFLFELTMLYPDQTGLNMSALGERMEINLPATALPYQLSTSGIAAVLLVLGFVLALTVISKNADLKKEVATYANVTGIIRKDAEYLVQQGSALKSKAAEAQQALELAMRRIDVNQAELGSALNMLEQTEPQNAEGLVAAIQGLEEQLAADNARYEALMRGRDQQNQQLAQAEAQQAQLVDRVKVFSADGSMQDKVGNLKGEVTKVNQQITALGLLVTQLEEVRRSIATTDATLRSLESGDRSVATVAQAVDKSLSLVKAKLRECRAVLGEDPKQHLDDLESEMTKGKTELEGYALGFERMRVLQSRAQYLAATYPPLGNGNGEAHGSLAGGVRR